MIKTDIKTTPSFIKILLVVAFFFCASAGFSQDRKIKAPKATKAADRMLNETIRQKLSAKSIVNGVDFRSVGPTVMSGRVTDIDVNPKDPTHFYVAYASGGLWVTRNNGTSFTPVFDREIAMSIGDIAVDWEHGEIIWLGTGENNSSRSSYSGVGIYKSSDKGETWEYKGLPESHHIGRIILHPTDQLTIWVAALGHLYSPNKERGIYKSIDGGNIWQHTLFVDENSGAIDLVIDDKNPNHLIAAIWNRTRRAWDFTGSGTGTGIHESMDGGQTWSLMTGADSGFPAGAGAGRVGLAYHSGTGTLYASVDNQNRREKEPIDSAQGPPIDSVKEIEKKEFLEMSAVTFMELENSRLQTFLEDSNFPDKYDSTKVKAMVKAGDIPPRALYDFLQDANADLFDTPVIGAEVYKYDRGSKKWTRTHEDYLDDVVYSYGYYFGLIRVDPADENKLYIAGVPILKSEDGGATWKGINAKNVHVDHHSLWINPNKSGHLINGNDGGINISYDDGETYIKCNNPAVGQFYTVNADHAEPYNVYGGLQDNGVWKGPSTYKESTGWHQTGKYPFESLIGGDGMQVEIDTRTNQTVYSGYQFGHYYRIGLDTDDYHYFHPSHELGELPLRWNWQTPIHLSAHHQDILYMGSNKFHRSMDQGTSWETLSDDLTGGGIAGNVPFASLTFITESPERFGLLYVGSDDGYLHRSLDGGESWTRVGTKLPANLWVSRIIASSHQKDRVYVTLNGYRWDDFKPYIYVSEDQGKKWTQLGQDLPNEPVNVIREDPENENILYVGTDNGLYVSLDRGKSFMTLGANLPAVAVHDLVVQTEDNDLVIGTHGRSIYIGNLNELRMVDTLTTDFAVFEFKSPRYRSGWGDGSWSQWLGFNEPEMELPVFVANKAPIHVAVVSDSLGTLNSFILEPEHKGLNYLTYDLTVTESSHAKLVEEGKSKAKANGKFYLEPGSYRLVFEWNGKEESADLIIEE